MGLRISTNVAALAARRHLEVASGRLQKNYARLATGRRIASASDDAAGLAISARMDVQVRSLQQAARNGQDGISMLQTAESGLAEIQSSLVRMRELAVQSRNGTLSGGDRDNLQAEFAALQANIDQIADTTTFNALALLNAESAITLQLGASAGSTSQLAFTTADVNIDALGIPTVGSAVSIGTVDAASTALTNLDTALDEVTGQRATIGATQNRIEASLAALAGQAESLAGARSRIIDVDIASETAALTKHSILQQAAISVLAQANAQPQAALSLLR